MHRLSTSLLGLGVLAAVSCGAPAELDVDRFPAIDDTGYTDGDATGSAGATATPPVTGAGGSVASPVGAAGVSSAAGATGTAPPVSGTGGAPNNGGGTPPAAAGAPAASGAGGGAMAAAGGSGMAPAGAGCPSDITVLFDRPIEQGGCNGSLCHIPGATSPDLVSPNLEQRLLNIQSTCNGLPYIGQSAEDSFLALKITTPPDGCGVSMPFFMPQALNADDEACILAWIDQVSGG